MVRTLVKSETLSVQEQNIAVRYFEVLTLRGLRRYSAEVILEPADHIILDDDSISNLQARVARLVPATIYCRRLAKITAA